MVNDYVFPMKVEGKEEKASVVHDGDEIIPHASYFICEGVDARSVVGGMSPTSKYAIFYSFDGNPIAKREHKFHFSAMEALLDPKAPKPQPVLCVVQQVLAASLGKKGPAGWFVVFYDKNGNQIKRYNYNRECHIITLFDGEHDGEYSFTDYELNESKPYAMHAKFPLDLWYIKRVDDEKVFAKKSAKSRCIIM